MSSLLTANVSVKRDIPGETGAIYKHIILSISVQQGRKDMKIVCFYMVKLFKYNGHTPLLELEVTILKCNAYG